MFLRFIAAVEAGGTTFKVAIAQDHPTNIIASTDFPTTSPDETLGRAVAWLNEQIALGRRFNSIGIASFGPVDLRRGSDTYGYITTTPKPGWQNTPVYSRFLSFGVPVGFDTDVNGAALSELAYGGHLCSGGDVESVTKMGSCCYITVGTGVGVGIAVDGRPVHGHQHPEGGHIFIPPHADDITSGFKGKCPFHGGNCVEGMVRSDAIAARLGLGIEDLGSVEDSHPVGTNRYLHRLLEGILLYCEIVVVQFRSISRSLAVSYDQATP